MKKLLLLICFFAASCSIPQLEDVKCTASRETVRSFYAQQLAENSAGGLTLESIGKKARFLTPELNAALQQYGDDGKVFMPAAPTGFKVGECSISGESSVVHTVRLFTIVDSKPVETEIKMLVEKRGDQWLADDLINDKNESLKSVLKQ